MARTLARKPNKLKLDTKLNEPSPEALSLPFYQSLPKTEEGILRWRIYVHKRCLVDEEFRQDILEMCAKDIVFFAATFCWAHETRDVDAFTKEAGKFPFVPWCDQVDLLAWLQCFGGRSDIAIEKTRGIGLSWVAMIYLMWKWLFSAGGKLEFGVLSKVTKNLDILGRPSSLMGKLDVLFENLPAWMKYSNGKTILARASSQTHKFENKSNGNVIIGFTANDEDLRSARLNVIIVDEAAYLPVDVQRWLAASQFVGPRVFISTHSGTGTMFYKLTTDNNSQLIRISTWWTANPARARGMYVVNDGKVEMLDPTYDYRDYPFCFEDQGLLRSPWVDGEFMKPGINPVKLKQEIWGIAAIDTSRMIHPNVTEAARTKCKPARSRCKRYEDEFIDDVDGEYFFWEEIFTSHYCIGVDPALGVVDAALAGVVVIDMLTGATVATAAFADMNSIDLAKEVVKLAEHLVGPRGQGYAKIIPETTGIGIVFLNELKRLGWTNIHEEGTRLGMANNDKGEKVLVEYGRALQDGDTVVMDERIVDDIEHFEYYDAGKALPELIFTGNVGHGDLGQAAALAWWGAKERRKAVLEMESRLKHDMEPIEREPGYQRARNWSKKLGWSAKFAMN